VIAPPRFFYGSVRLSAAFMIITLSIGMLFTLAVFRPREGFGESALGTA